jgi:hypothetical protein
MDEGAAKSLTTTTPERRYAFIFSQQDSWRD